MRNDDFEKMSPMERREFLKFLGGFLALPMISQNTKFAIYEVLMGKAYAQSAVTPPINFLEVNFRDQWDFGNVFVAPGIAKDYANLKGQIALFNDPILERNGFYVTSQAEILRPHLDTIAVMELGENTLDGANSVHGHEAGNPLRSPGRVKGSAAGKTDMGIVDKRPGVDGNEVLYSSSPTPVVLHNYYQKTLTPELRNGIVMRSSIKSYEHTFYHFHANLANAQVDRFFDRNTLTSAFSSTTVPTNPVDQTTVQKFGATIANLLKKIDPAYLQRINNSGAQTSHTSKLTALGTSLTPTTSTIPMTSANLPLSTAERTYWTTGISGQLDCGEDASTCKVTTGLWNLGELYAYAFKLFKSGQVRSIGIDFNMEDVHTNRTAFLLNTQAQQSALPLGRMIESLKGAGLYDRTLIAMYTTDGSRSPLPSSTGEGTKNAVILAGGMVKGGYYGDIKMVNGKPTYFRPADTGIPIPTGTTGRDTRVAAADVYKTIGVAAGIPLSVLDTFPDIKPGKVLTYMIKT